MIPADLRYTKEHEWVRVDGDMATVGITDFAQKQLGDIVYVDLPAVGRQLAAGSPCATVESVKSVSDVFAPVSGSVTETNGQLGDQPELVNQDPYGAGWLFRVRVTDVGELLSAADYARLVGEGA